MLPAKRQAVLNYEQNGLTWRFDSMDATRTYHIVLPKGQAPRPFFELTENERREIGKKIFQEVTELAAKVGALPVTSRNVPKEASNKLSS